MQIYMHDNDQFGPDGPQRGARGELVGFTYGGEDEETMFLIIFEGFEDYPFWVYPKHIGYYDGSGTFPHWTFVKGMGRPSDLTEGNVNR